MDTVIAEETSAEVLSEDKVQAIAFQKFLLRVLFEESILLSQVDLTSAIEHLRSGSPFPESEWEKLLIPMVKFVSLKGGHPDFTKWIMKLLEPTE